MDLQASESLLEAYHQRSRRFRRRVRRRIQNLANANAGDEGGEDAGADEAGEDVEEVEPGLAQDENGHEVDLNAALPDEADAAGVGDNLDDDDWSFNRIDEAKRLDFLEQILLKENHQFHLHC